MVIVGAGIQGLSCAYHLATLGVSDIVVLEAEGVGAGSSSRSASMVMLQREDASKIALSVFSYLRYQRFREEFGVDPEFNRIGFLSVVPASVAALAEKRARTRQLLGVPTQILTPTEIAELCPIVNVDDIPFGVYGPDDGYINVPAVLTALETEVRRRGVDLRVGVAATAIHAPKGKVESVDTAEGRVYCEHVVNAAGAAAKQVASWVGLDLPIENRRRSILILPPVPGVKDRSPMVEDAQEEYYYRPDNEGILFGLGKDVTSEISRTVDSEVLSRARGFARHRFPPLQEMQPVKGWSGLRPLTPDGRPIIGPVDEVLGYVNCCGWGGEGIQHAPAGGQLVSEVIALGRAESLDITPFLYRRFTSAEYPGYG